MARRTFYDGAWLRSSNWRDRGDDDLAANSETVERDEPVIEPQSPAETTDSQSKSFEQSPGFLPLDFRSRLSKDFSKDSLPPIGSETGMLIRKCDSFFNQFRVRKCPCWVWDAYNIDERYELDKCIVKWVFDQDQEYIKMDEDEKELAARKHCADVEKTGTRVKLIARRMKEFCRSGD
ncbi:hypothetical protein DL98DRAFT_623194 [Cadophora sp. DSE1049]|nr:hypothetical protein DL98DRAFT_623194 [Cadophora sp. DSE1049]